MTLSKFYYKMVYPTLNELYTMLQQRLPPQFFRYTRLAWRLLNPFAARASLRRRRIVRVITAERGFVVQGGPFADMKLVSDTGDLDSHLLLGSYESELHGAIEGLTHNDYDQVVNVGCASGYYAVGLALRLPTSRIYATDSSPHERDLCRKTAKLNGVSDRITVMGITDLQQLQSLLGLGGKTLIVMDCEGCERDLLRPDLVPQLVTCDLVIELHDLVDPPISEIMSQRFAETHHIKLVNSVERDPDQFPVLRPLNVDERKMAVAEFRPHSMQWAVMVSK